MRRGRLPGHVVRRRRRRRSWPRRVARRRRAAAQRRGAALVMLAITSDLLGLPFLRGMVATVNPCGFVLLPTYLMYFLGVEAAQRCGRRAGVGPPGAAGRIGGHGRVHGRVRRRRGSRLGSRHGCSTTRSTSPARDRGRRSSSSASAMLFGYRPRFATPAHRPRRARPAPCARCSSTASPTPSCRSSCTLGLFLTAVIRPGRRDGLARRGRPHGVLRPRHGVAGRARSPSRLAVANQACCASCARRCSTSDQLAAAFVLLSGVYLIYYFWVVDCDDGASDPSSTP